MPLYIQRKVVSGSRRTFLGLDPLNISGRSKQDKRHSVGLKKTSDVNLEGALWTSENWDRGLWLVSWLVHYWLSSRTRTTTNRIRRPNQNRTSGSATRKRPTPSRRPRQNRRRRPRRRQRPQRRPPANGAAPEGRSGNRGRCPGCRRAHPGRARAVGKETRTRVRYCRR